MRQPKTVKRQNNHPPIEQHLPAGEYMTGNFHTNRTPLSKMCVPSHHSRVRMGVFSNRYLTMPYLRTNGTPTYHNTVCLRTSAVDVHVRIKTREPHRALRFPLLIKTNQYHKIATIATAREPAAPAAPDGRRCWSSAPRWCRTRRAPSPEDPGSGCARPRMLQSKPRGHSPPSQHPSDAPAVTTNKGNNDTTGLEY